MAPQRGCHVLRWARTTRFSCRVMLRVSSRSTRLFTAPSSSRHLSALQCAPQNRRTFGTAPSARSSDEDSGASKGPEARRAGGGGRTNTVRGYRHWLQTEGRQWKNPTKPKNWLGGDVVSSCTSTLNIQPIVTFLILTAVPYEQDL